MTGNAALTEEMTRLLDEHPREARENRFSASLCGEMAVMRLLHNGTKKKMTAGELSSLKRRGCSSAKTTRLTAAACSSP